MDGVATYPGVGNMVGVDAFVRDVDLQVPPLGIHLFFHNHRFFY